MLGFVSHLCVVKSKLLVTEEPVERKGFPPSATWCLGVKGARIVLLLAGSSLGSWEGQEGPLDAAGLCG